MPAIPDPTTTMSHDSVREGLWEVDSPEESASFSGAESAEQPATAAADTANAPNEAHLTKARRDTVGSIAPFSFFRNDCLKRSPTKKYRNENLLLQITYSDAVHNAVQPALDMPQLQVRQNSANSGSNGFLFALRQTSDTMMSEPSSSRSR